MPAALSPAAARERLGLGFYGKLPMRGDFVSRRLPHSFIEPWDQWLQAAIGQSREQLGEAWLSAYLAAPLWRFLLGAGICGEAEVLGVMMSSVDRVGRYFPLTLAVMLPAGASPLCRLLPASAWFESLEQVALAALAEGADFDAFERSLDGVPLPPSAQLVTTDDGPRMVSAGDAGAGVLGDAPAGSAGGMSLWSTKGSEEFAESLVAASGLPPPGGFAAFLDGQWERWGWRTRR